MGETRKQVIGVEGEGEEGRKRDGDIEAEWEGGGWRFIQEK